MCVSVHMHVCGHLSVCVCVTSVCMCVRATVCLSVCCVFMRVRGHLCVCASVCDRERVDMYVQVWSLLFCNVHVYHFHSYHYCSIWHGYTVHNDMESMILFLKFHAGVVTLKISYASSRNW